MTVLKATNITISFGGVKAVDDFSIKLNENEVVGLIGPNGAGKTTVFNMLSGLYTPDSGSITICEKPAVGGIHSYVKNGVCRTFQNIRLLSEMSVLENVITAIPSNETLIGALFHTKSFSSEEERLKAKAYSLLKLFDLEKKSQNKASSLSYGELRRLELARALATNARVLLLDEPSAGMNAKETSELVRCIKKIRKTVQLAVLVIEHDMSFITGLCERLVVINHGITIAEGTPAEIAKNPEVISAYLGE